MNNTKQSMMTTQAQGKGKKKNKEVTKITLDEFNKIAAPHGHSVVSLKMPSMDWAETMADYDQQSAETQQIIVPAAPRAQRGPGVEFESLPNDPPFRVSLFNLPISVEEKDIQERFFQGLAVTRIEVSKASTTVELASKEALYEALCKDGGAIRGKVINVCLFGEQPQNNYGSDRYGGRGSYGDRYGDRSSGGFGQRGPGDRYGDRSSSYGRDRDSSYGGFRSGGGGFGQRGAYGDRYDDRSNFRDSRGQYTSGGGEPESEEPTNWRARPNIVKPSPPPSSYNSGSRQPYMHPRSQDPYQPAQGAPSHHQQYQQPEPYYQRNQHSLPPSNNQSYSQFNNQASSNNRPLSSSSTSEERPKLILSKRKTPINPDDVSSVSRNEAIFGKAKPSSTPYQKMNEVEEKLKAVHITDRKESSKPSSLAGSQTGSAPRSRRVSSNHSESNS